MPVITRPYDYNVNDLYVDLSSLCSHQLYLKVEGLNFAGSIKLKAAARMIEAVERSGQLTRESTLVESSSGNLGIALSVIAASKGYRFICVTDSRCNGTTRQAMETLGTQVRVITEPDLDGGFLGARLDHVRRLCAQDSSYIWLNQYVNPNNWQAHYDNTAPAIAAEFPDLDVLFIGAGTTGTLMGCARYFHDAGRKVRIVAVDSIGSVTFGGPSSSRMIPGLGTSVRPQLLDMSYVDDVRHVAEADTVRCCHLLARKGFLFGGSTGTVVSGARQWLAEHAYGRQITTVAIAPDLGERYLDSIYQPNWVQDIYGDEVLASIDALDALAGS